MKTSTPSCLWKFGFSDRKTIYLFGSIHLPADIVKWHRNQIFRLISECDYYLGEMNLDQMSTIGLKGANILPQGKRIVDLFPSQKHYDKIRRSIQKSFNVDIDEYRHLKPVLLQHLLDNSISGGKDKIIDQLLWDFAKAEGKKCSGLESVEEQIEVLNQIDLEYQTKLLKTIAFNTKTYHRRIKKLIHLYNIQDVQQLYLTSSRSTGKYRKLMIYDRNKKMAKKINELKSGSYFISVGVGHLYGNEGLLALLKREGVRLIPMSYAID